jgi:hypothetical protein
VPGIEPGTSGASVNYTYKEFKLEMGYRSAKEIYTNLRTIAGYWKKLLIL